MKTDSETRGSFSHISALCVFTALSGMVAVCNAGGSSQEIRHLKDARLLLDGLRPENTSYRHKDGEVVWKEHRGNVCHTDCSGFINALFEYSYGYTEADFKKWFDSKRPTARRYVEQIFDENGFKHIRRIQDLRPGDIIAVKYPPGDKNTGHVMLAASSAKPHKATQPLIAGTEQWEVTVIDCSMSAHGPKDTRRTEDGKSHSGLGRGVLRLYTDDKGHLAGYAWSTFANSEFHGREDRPICIGRLVPGFKPK